MTEPQRIKLKGHLRVNGVSWSALPKGNYQVHVTFAGGALPVKREFGPAQRTEMEDFAKESLERFFDDQAMYDGDDADVLQ